MPHLIGIFGGVYNNHVALAATVADARRRGAGRLVCLGDLGGFGPHPDRVLPILIANHITVLQGNYDHSVGHGLPDCGCGYTDPRDNHYARLSYAYTLSHTSDELRAYQRALPKAIVEEWAGRRVRMAHGSPRRVNEFLWESTSPDAFLARMLDDAGAEVLFVTHTGIPWQRRLPDGRLVVNVGAIGRPANDGTPDVWYAMVTVDETAAAPISAELVRLAYDHASLAAEMRAEHLPAEFIATIETGWWTTCLEILPTKERMRGRY